MSAAARVFDIAELLTMILTEVALEEANIGETTGLLLDPAVSLFPLQRVNTTFRDIIQGTKELRQLMFLEFAEPGSEEADYLKSPESKRDSAILRPMWWMFELFKGWSTTRYMQQEPMEFGVVYLKEIEIARFGVKTDRRSGAIDVSRNCPFALHEKASWRKVKLFRVPYVDKTPYVGKKVIIIQPIRLFIKYGPRKEHSGYRFAYREMETLVDADSTLGDFWEFYYDWYEDDDERIWNRVLETDETSMDSDSDA